MLLNEAREDITMRKEMISAIKDSNESFREAMENMSSTVKAFGETMARSMELMARSFSQQPSVPQLPLAFNQPIVFNSTNEHQNNYSTLLALFTPALI